jgi:uncharacterized protein (TIGR00725 family)
MSETRSKFRIGVIGGSRPDPASSEAAYRVGRLIAEHGAVVVCGGLGGVMEAAARGAGEAGGLTIGILPGSDPGDANPHIDVPIATGIGYARNALVVMNADALIAIDGAFGTLSEIAYGGVYERPVVGLGTWNIHGVIPAGTPEEAVRLALEKAAGRR